MRTIDIEKLQKENNVVINTIDKKGRYMVVINAACIGRVEASALLAQMPSGSFALVVSGKPDDAISIYEVVEEVTTETVK
jgi:hypothetical protein